MPPDRFKQVMRAEHVDLEMFGGSFPRLADMRRAGEMINLTWARTLDCVVDHAGVVGSTSE